MKRKSRQARIIIGLVAAVLGPAAALGFAACGTAAEDCNNTRTCPAPPCSVNDAGNPFEGIDGACCEQEDGETVCEP